MTDNGVSELLGSPGVVSSFGLLGSMDMMVRKTHVPQRWCAQLSATVTFAIVWFDTGFLPMTALCAMLEILHPTLGKRGRAPQKVLSSRELQESSGQLIADLTASVCGEI